MALTLSGSATTQSSKQQILRILHIDVYLLPMENLQNLSQMKFFVNFAIYEDIIKILFIGA